MHEKLWWQLPGPAKFITNLTEDLRSHKNVMLCMPLHKPQGLRQALKSRLEHDGWLWDRLDTVESSWLKPLRFLFDYFITDYNPDEMPTILKLITNESFGGRIIWLENLTTDFWPAWKNFLSEYQSVVHAYSDTIKNPTCFCIVLEGKLALDPLPSNTFLAYHNWSGKVDQLDMTLYTANLFADRNLPDLQKRLGIAITTHLALWDPQISDQLSQAPIEDILYPLNILTDVARERNWLDISSDLTNSNSTETNWYLGLEDISGRKRKFHSCILAAHNRNKDLEHRMWNAQVEILLPFVEEVRQELLIVLHNNLSVPYDTPSGTKIEDIRELEISHIFQQIRNLPKINPTTKNLVELLVKIRNSLSHLSAVKTETLLNKALLDYAKIIFG